MRSVHHFQETDGQVSEICERRMEMRGAVTIRVLTGVKGYRPLPD